MDRHPAGRMRQLLCWHRILDRLSGSRTGYNTSQLAERLGYTTKTTCRDLRALRGDPDNLKWRKSEAEGWGPGQI